jgi:hypothetical protein
MKAKLTKITGIYTLLDDNDRMVASDDVDMQKDYEIGKLSLKNCDEIFGVTDVEKLAEEFVNDLQVASESVNRAVKLGYEEGFNKAMELNKMFTLEQVLDAFYAGWISKDKTYPEAQKSYKGYLERHVVQQPTEIEVEIEMICPHPEDAYRCGLQYGCDTECYHPNKIPYLNSQGCLVLTKKI